jgi:hypothetical protein
MCTRVPGGNGSGSERAAHFLSMLLDGMKRGCYVCMAVLLLLISDQCFM